ncbi:MAG: PEP/pyruvate-binding domain-containing protein [Planctomycetota bacterium]
MAEVDPSLTTGLRGLDAMLTGLVPGDNVVWQVSSTDEYLPFVEPYCREALRRGERLAYFRFARHAPLVSPAPGIEIRELRPEAGFEAFVSEIHRAVGRVGRRGYCLFDVLSDLAAEWYSDQMLGNFFLLTCPYILEVGPVAYFGLLQGHHSNEATEAILDTAQIVLDVFRREETLYVQANKVDGRHSPTMYWLHERDGDEMRPVSDSATIAGVLGARPWSGFDTGAPRTGFVDRAFDEAEELAAGSRRRGETPAPSRESFRRLLRTCFSRDERVLGLLERHLPLEDVLAVRRRMIGTGLIGGKSVGMLLARAILREAGGAPGAPLEPHDSFYVGSDVYYTFVVRNGLWRIRERQKSRSSFLEGAEEAREKMLAGTFPEYVLKQFGAMLDYFGQSPIIVRSSSLLEDNFGNSFAGKYESVFCPNQGTKEQRLERFLAAVRTIYASTVGERALAYRAQRRLLDRDEQMALLVQRVSGRAHGSLFYPHLAGVGLSYNPYVWSDAIDPKAGVLRLVFGLGTRAVERCDDDYTRVVALNAPERQPAPGGSGARRYVQRRVDAIDLAGNALVTREFSEVARAGIERPLLDLFASPERSLEERVEDAGSFRSPGWLLTFRRLLRDADFARRMRRTLEVLTEAYDYPVEIEFTANFSAEGSYRVNLVQCRPLQVKGAGTVVEPPRVERGDIVFEARGAVIGQSRVEAVDRAIYVVPSIYGRLPIQKRYAVARLVGRLGRSDGSERRERLLLIGPGRWGTTTPSLGVPVSFAEIQTASVLCEIVAMRDGLVPDVSLGTHFFNELVEMDMLYLALFPGKEGNFVNEEFFERFGSKAPEDLAGAEGVGDAVRIVEARRLPGGAAIQLHADALAQRVIAYLTRAGA